MHVEKKRIFVSNLPPCIDENEIKTQFSQYGKVVSIDIKQRKINLDENTSPVFAFVNIETDNKTLQKCFQEFSNYNWQGYYVTLELAKESFLDRLKREREEAQAKNLQEKSSSTKYGHKYIPPTSSNDVGKVYHSSSESEEDDKIKQNGTSKISKSEETSSSSESDQNEEIQTKPKRFENKLKNPVQTNVVDGSSSDFNNFNDKSKTLQKSEEIESSDDDGIKLVVKSNKHKAKDVGLKIESINSTPIHVINKKGSVKEKKDQKAIEADEKRKKSLMQMKNSYNQQKLSIRKALSKIDTKQNKIIFDEDDEQNKRKYDDDHYNHTRHKKKKLSLFEDEAGEDNNDINFEIKSQFEGRKGQKLLELQSKFTNDKRFTLDDRFADDEDENDLETQPDDEKNKQLEILESVLGQKVRKDIRNDQNTHMPKAMLRYDPSKPEHSKFQIKREEHPSKKDKKEKKSVQAPIPEVSKEKFYLVQDNLKESLKEKESFSLLSMFGETEEKTEDEPQMPQELKKTKKFDNERNPFKYDSSDTEDEDQSNQKNSKKQRDENLEQKSPFKWTESFFFETDDVRLKDGVDFLKNVSPQNPELYREKRRTLQRIIYKRTRDVEYDKRKFERKQRKRIAVKKAKKS